MTFGSPQIPEPPSRAGTVQPAIFTVGHSNHSMDDFLRLLRRHDVDAVADVRSTPYSRRHPQFNQKALASGLELAGIRYLFLGDRLGARPDDPKCYVDGKVQYDRLADTPAFHSGIRQVIDLIGAHRAALLCAEREPLDCHRMILVGKHLDAAGVRVAHILGDGTLQEHAHTVQRLLRMMDLGADELFRDQAEIIEEAFARRASGIAYSKDA